MKYKNWVYPSKFILDTPRKLFTISTILYLVATVAIILLFFVITFEDVIEHPKQTLKIISNNPVLIAQTNTTFTSSITKPNKITLFYQNQAIVGKVHNIKNIEQGSLLYFKLHDSITVNQGMYEFILVEDTTRKSTLFKKLIR